MASTGGAFVGTGGKVGGTGGAATGGTMGSGGSATGTGGAGTGGKIVGTGGAAGAATDAGTGSDVASTDGPRTGGSGSGGAGTGGTSGTGGSSTGNCTAPPDPSPLVGWASQSGSTTGGGSATPTTVTTLAELQSAAKGTTAAVIYVKGVMAAGALSIGSNKTIAGICGAEIHGHVGISGSTNVIVRNIKIVGYAVGNCSLDPSYDSTLGCSSGDDAISVENNANHIWFDHCDISDGTDGNLDITKGADFVTVSWTKFHYTPRTDNSGSDSTGASGHRYSNLVGGSDGVSGDVGKLNITWHHNWWADNVVERQPRVRYGKNHVLNNLYTSTSSNYCVRAGMQAQILVENNAFVGVKNPQQFNSTADQGTSYITAQGNLYSGTSGTQSTGGGGTPFTTPPYAYTPEPTAGLQASIQSGAGPK
jgi:pectate lyase